MEPSLLFTIAGSILGVILFIIIPLSFRRVVSTNEVHIVQGGGKPKSYGAAQASGNSYYQWPSWIPFIGVTTSVLPLSIIPLKIDNYEALDSGRLPLLIDIQTYFRISDSNLAAQRISSLADLKSQLAGIIQGAARVIIAATDVENILGARSTLGEKFTQEVSDKLANEFGVDVVGYIELMDIRDGKDSKVIHNIMEKKKSHIEMESRIEVAKNKKNAESAEIEANREVQMKTQEAQEQIGKRKAEAQRVISLENETTAQKIAEQSKLTTEKQMQVTQVANVKQAEIEKEMAVIKAEQEKEVQLKKAEAQLETEKRIAEAIALNGQAQADAKKALELAPIQAQIELAKEIGQNASYQQYLVTLEQVKANKDVGIAQANALQKAEIKVIANSDGPNNAISSISDMFTAKGGAAIGTMLNSLANTGAVEEIKNKVLQ